jgi:HK97 family phage major capsid protein
MASYKPTAGMKSEAQKGLDWRREHGRGGTAVGIARARDIVSGKNLSESTVKRMYSFFSRHEVDKQGEGFTPDEDGFPSNGRIAWALWGGDAGFRWSKTIVDRLKKEDDGRMAEDMDNKVERHIKDVRETEDSYIIEFGKSMPEENDEARPYHDDEEERAAPDALKVGDFVSWNTAGGRARGKIERIERDGTIDIPDSDFTVTGSEDDPAALIRVYRGGEESDTLVGHKFSTLTKINPIRENDDEERSLDKEEIDQIAEEEYVAQANEDVLRFYAEENLQRAFQFDRNKIDEENRTIMIGVSSEEPVERRFGMEVLGHNENEIDMAFMSQGRSPLLLDHDATKQIGVVEEFGIDTENKRTVAKVRFSKNQMADEVYRDVLDGIRQNISVGYQVNSMEKEEEERDGVPVYRVNSWSPLEVSAVSIPADQSRLVGFARSKEKKAQIKINPNSKQDRKMENKVEETKAPEVNVQDMKRDFAKEAKAIIDLGVQHNKRDLANEAIANGASLAQFRGTLLETIANDKPLDLPSNVDMNETEQREYSLLKAVSESAQGKLSGLEKEVSDEIAARTGKAARGFYMPTSINFRANQVVGTNNVGGFLKPTDHLGDEFIEALKANLVVARAGARTLQGLQGDVQIPKMSAETSNVSFVAEDSAPSEGNATFAQVTMSPKTLACQLDISRKLMLQSDPSIEAVLRNDVIASFARKIDEVAIEGGGSNEPSGIIASSTGNVVACDTNGGAITFQDVVDMIEKVESDNAILNDGSVAFVGNPKVTANLRTLSKAGTEAQFVLGDDGKIIGYDYLSSTLVPSDLTKGSGSNLSALIFGDFSQLMLGFYSGVDVIVDPYTGSSAGTTRLAFFQDFDIALRHDDSFSVCKDIVT